MATVSRSGPGDGTENPEEINVTTVDPNEEGYAVHENPILVLMWHGNGYKRDDCWIQIDADAACDLDSYL